MITPLQRDIFRGLETLLELSPPDMRIGQLVGWLGDLAEAHGKQGLGNIDDEDFLAVIESFRQDLAARQMDVAESA
jgi:hypothetical protein